MSKRKRPEDDAGQEAVADSSSQPVCAAPTATGMPSGQAVVVSDLKFSHPLSGLDNLPRKNCSKCNRTRKYYCYECLLPIYPEHHSTTVALPLQLYVYKHFNERNSKSTAIATAVFSPDAHVRTYPEQQLELDPATTLVVYPHPDAYTLDAVPELHKYKNVVVIEATWQQSKGIARDPTVAQYTKVRLNDHRSIFWRYQDKDESYLATIEAIYFFFVEYKNAMLKAQGSGEVYNGEYDDLLFFYGHMYETIQRSYKADRSRTFTRKARPNYIKYDDDGPASPASPSPKPGPSNDPPTT